MKKIMVIATGGTIAGSGNMGESAKYKAGTINVEEIVRSIPQLEQLAHVEMIQLCNVDSNDVGFVQWKQLRAYCEQFDADDSIDGIVITHGTDTLEETAFFLNLTLNCHKPIVLTGSMRPATSTSADGPMNLFQAVSLACSEEAYDKGVLAVFSDTIYSGRDLQKTNSYKTDAFKMGEFGSLGYMRDWEVHLLNEPHKKHTHQTQFSKLKIEKLPKVSIYYVHSDCDPKLLEYMLKTNEGVVIAGTGAGNYPSSIQSVIEAHPDSLIVRSSRVLEGAVFPSAVFDPLDRTIPALKFSCQKARILLQLSCLVTKDKECIKKIFLTY